MEAVISALPFVAFLACPVMMAVCFFSMRKMGHSEPMTTEAEAVARLPEERVAAIQRQLLAVQAELTSLQSSERQTPRAVDGEASRIVEIGPGTAHAAQRPA